MVNLCNLFIERCATFDGCEAYSKVIPLRGK